MWFAFARECAHYFRVPFPLLRWALRGEDGELTGRAHFHYLFGEPLLRTTKADRFWMLHKWEALGGGMGRVRVYDPRLAGAAYICKCLGMDGPTGANVYELNKFGTADRFYLSHAARAAMSRVARDLKVARMLKRPIVGTLSPEGRTPTLMNTPARTPRLVEPLQSAHHGPMNQRHRSSHMPRGESQKQRGLTNPAPVNS